jgi:hypothetical protein
MNGRCRIVNKSPNKTAWKYIPHLRRIKKKRRCEESNKSVWIVTLLRTVKHSFLFSVGQKAAHRNWCCRN